MNYFEFYAKCQEFHRLRPAWRWGQTCFNVLYRIDSDLADSIRSTDIDPFYKDDMDMDNFWEFIYNHFD